MKRLYDKSKLWFALVWIIVYVVGTSIVDGLTQTHGATLGFHLVLSLVLLAFLKLGKSCSASEIGGSPTGVLRPGPRLP